MLVTGNIMLKTFIDVVDTSEVLQVDATNAFNKINTKAMLYNLKILCPYFSAYVYNNYSLPAQLLVSGKGRN